MSDSPPILGHAIVAVNAENDARLSYAEGSAHLIHGLLYASGGILHPDFYPLLYRLPFCMVGKPDVDRRTVLKSLGGVAGASLVGGAGMMALSGGASATAGGTIDNPSPVTSDDGEITYVATQTTGRLNWDGFDEPAKYAQMLLRVKYKRNGNVFANYDIHNTGKFGLDQDWGGKGEETNLVGDHEAGQKGHIASDADWGIAQANRESLYNGGYGLPNNPAPTDPLEAETDGGQVRTSVILESEYRLFDSNGSELTGTKGYPDRPVFSENFVVEVNNQEATTSGGSEDAEGHSGDSATVGV